ncbi:MAG: T9SS type A sorting domain-containing protein [Flavobacteriales bacterium]|nr:T9SS type A sorting domain-containing protein [Flavobacteriales bacterium]
MNWVICSGAGIIAFLIPKGITHYIYKIEEDDDGSLYLGGDLRNEDYNHPEYVYPSQRHWFMKLDVCGCLIPGCDPSCNYSGCSTINPATLSASDYFNFGPNPTSNVLSIYLKDNQDLVDAQLSIFNAAGQLVEQYICEESNITYILDCSNYAAGSYTMTLNAGQTMLQTEKVQIIR